MCISVYHQILIAYMSICNFKCNCKFIRKKKTTTKNQKKNADSWFFGKR